MAAEGHGFDDAVLYYDHLLEHLRWKNLGHVLAGGNMEAGDTKERQKLSKPMRLENLFNNLSERTNYYETNYFA